METGMDTLLWETQLVGGDDKESPMSAYQNLNQIMQANFLDPYQNIRSEAFGNLARYAEMVTIPANGQVEQRFDGEVVELLNRTRDLYAQLNEAGLSSNGYDLTGGLSPHSESKSEFNKQRALLAEDLMSLAMRVWDKYSGLDDLAEAADLQSTQYKHSVEFGNGLELAAMQNATHNLSEEVDKAYASPEFKLALAAYTAAKALHGKGLIFSPTEPDIVEKFQYFVMVAMKDNNYLNAMRALASHISGQEGLFSHAGAEDYSGAQTIRVNNW